MWVELFLLSLLILVLWMLKKNTLNLPPGPTRLPIVGSLYAINRPLHICFTTLNQNYGPIVHLKAGAVPFVIISNTQLTMEVLKSRDLEFSSRPNTKILREITLQHNSIGLSPYSDNVKKLRRIAATHLFATSKLNAGMQHRHMKAQSLVSNIFHICSKEDGVVHLTTLLHELTSSSILHMLFGRQLKDSEFESQCCFLQTLLKHINDQALVLGITDMFPWLGWLDLSGVEKKLKTDLIPKLMSFFEKIIEDHKKEANQGGFQDFVDILLDLKKEDALQDIQITGVLNSMIVAGIGTSEATLDYAFAELIRHPKVLQKAQKEIKDVVGQNKFIQEQELSRLPYLSSIVKETLRLHNPIPLGLPHCNPAATKLAGYDIPANSTVFINHYAMGRDESIWTNAHEFWPERFYDSAAEDLNFFPFGAGRRKCIGYAYAMRYIPLVIGRLLQAFDWGTLPGQDVDMKETEGGSIRRKNELIVRASPRLEPNMYVFEPV